MARQDSSPSFAADILPKFRPQDVGCMQSRGVPLSDPNWMTDPAGNARYPDHANARYVFAKLQSGRMPPDGPWSETWLATFEAWMASGFAP